MNVFIIYLLSKKQQIILKKIEKLHNTYSILCKKIECRVVRELDK